MKITGVDFVTVPTRDFEKASHFYGDVLGLRFSKRWGDMPAAEYETGNLTIAVMHCHQAIFEDPDGNVLDLHHRYAPKKPQA